jgi:regulator of RNase E activity RraA
VHATTFGALGCLGGVTNGTARDVDEARAMRLRLFSAQPFVPQACIQVGTAGGPVESRCLLVAPGDVSHADQHEVLKIPLKRLRHIDTAILGDRPGQGRTA